MRAAQMARHRLPPGAYRGHPVVGQLTFPGTQLGVRVEIALGADLTAIPGTWVYTDVTAYVLVRDLITYTTGRSDEASQAEPTQIRLTVQNSDGRWTRKNPLGEWYGRLTIGTPIRISVNPGTGYVVRATGFISSLPVRWDKSGNDHYVPIEATGLLARLGRGNGLAVSAMTQATMSRLDPVAFWPCEDKTGSTIFASATGPHAMTITGTVVAGSDSTVPISGALPVFSAGASATGVVATYAPTNFTLGTLIGMVPTEPAGPVVLLELGITGGTAQRWRVVLDPSTDTLSLYGYSSAGVLLFTGQDLVTWIYGDHTLVEFALNQVGADLSWSVGAASGTFVAATVGQVGRATLAPDGATAGMVLGQLSIVTESNSIIWSLWTDQGSTWPGNRVVDVCEANGIPLYLPPVLIFPPSYADMMGPQVAGSPLALIRDAELTGTAVLSERDHGLQFRTRSRSYNRDITMELDYAQGHLDAIEPADDQQRLRNDVTVLRSGGSRARAVVPAASIQAQGRIDTSVTISLQTDEFLQVQADWRLHLGSSDDPRFPRLGLNLAARPELADRWTRCEIGSRITVANPPDDLPPDLIDLIVEGFSETIGPFTWDVVANCSPAGPWTVRRIEDPVLGRLGLTDSTLAVAINTTDTSLSVATATLPLLTTRAADFPYDVDIGGERVTVTNTTGASSPQTVTVTRSVNTTVKSHAVGAALQLWRPAVIAL